MTITFEQLVGVPGHADGVARLRVRALGYTKPGVFGRCRLRLRAVGTTSATLVVATPQPPLSCVHSLRLGAKGKAVSHSVVNGNALLRLSHRGFAGKPGTISGRSWLRLKAFGVQGVGNTAYAMLVAQPTEVSSFGDQWFSVVDEAFQFDAFSSRIYASVIRAPLRLGGRLRTTYSGSVAAVDYLAVGERGSWMVNVLALSRLHFGTIATADYKTLARAISRVILGGRAKSYGEALQLVADAMVFGEVCKWLQLVGAADSLSIQERADSLYAAFARAVDRMIMAAKASPEFTLTVLLRDSFSFDDHVGHEAELVAQLADALGFAMTLSFDNGEFIAWVLNTDNKGITKYTEYPYNSFAKIGGRYYGAHAGGIARLDGDTDSGEPIAARLRLGMSDFGSRRVKGFSDVYLGVSGDGKLLLKAIYLDERTREKKMVVYRMQPRPGAASRDARFKVGKGMRAVDWDFELENIDGGQFDLLAIQFQPLVTSRRTRG